MTDIRHLINLAEGTLLNEGQDELRDTEAVEKIEIHEFVFKRFKQAGRPYQRSSKFEVRVFYKGQDEPLIPPSGTSHRLEKAQEYVRGFSETSGYYGEVKHRIFHEKMVWVEVSE